MPYLLHIAAFEWLLLIDEDPWILGLFKRLESWKSVLDTCLEVIIPAVSFGATSCAEITHFICCFECLVVAINWRSLINKNEAISKVMKQAVFSEMLQPVQVVCDVSGGGQVVVLNHCSPDQIPHSMMTDLDTQSLPKLSVQSCSTEDQLPHGELLIDLKESYHAFFFIMHFFLLRSMYKVFYKNSHNLVSCPFSTLSMLLRVKQAFFCCCAFQSSI